MNSSFAHEEFNKEIMRIISDGEILFKFPKLRKTQKYQKEVTTGFWKNKQGKLVKISGMDDEYLVNCLCFAIRNQKVQGTRKIKELQDECTARGLTV